MIQLSGNNAEENETSFLPDLTTLLDILFILLVFFILTAGAVYRSLDLTLPEGVKEAPVAPSLKNHLMLEIKPNSYSLDGKDFETFADLKKEFRHQIISRPKDQLIIAGDKTISLERLLPVLTYLQSQGIDAANILMKSESSK